MPKLTDADLYKMWWYALAYGASAQTRMKMMDENRGKK